MELSKTTHNKNKILDQGYAYVKNKDLANGWKSYECERRRVQEGCTGSIKINGVQVEIVKALTHAPNPSRNESIKTVSAMKHRAQTTVEATQEINGNAVAGIQDAVAAELPTLSTTRRNTRRQASSCEQSIACTVATR